MILQAYIKAVFRLFQTGILLLISSLLCAQTGLHKPGHRSRNQLDTGGPYLKTIYAFTPVSYDSMLQPGPDPLLVPRYRDTILMPTVFDAVFTGRVRVYNPNFWGSVPQLIEKAQYEEFDTVSILKYLGAGRDTSLFIDNSGNVQTIPEYHEIPYSELMGIFFFESWWLDQKYCRLYKDVIAYLPIREYLTSFNEGYQIQELHRRLLFMVIPEWSSGSKKPVKIKPGKFRLLSRDIRYEMNLYNKPYELYLNRKDEYGQISQGEYNEWQYHRFDFYRYFDPDLFLERIISALIDGRLRATLPGNPGKDLSRDEIISILQNRPGTGLPVMPDNIPDMEEDTGNRKLGILPEDYPISDLNSIIFTEDWYINPDNLQIYKDVKSMTITRTETLEDQYTGEFLKGEVKPLLTVRF